APRLDVPHTRST
ncbi:tRNA (5-methylaminomethyl-2-thiouridylate)-methyltransferase, partial [Vibrio parahaemolyticus V-223/04]